MSEVFVPYLSALQGLVVLGALFIVQLLVMDVASMRAKHTPGVPVTGDHDDVLFRVARAHANTNENLPVFVLVTLTAFAVAADPWWVNGLVWGFVLARALHMAAYYADLRNLRSGAFVIGLLCTIALVVVDGIACLY